MNCKYCGKEVRNSGNILLAGGISTCQASPTKKHVGVPDGKKCVFCGREVRNSGNVLLAGGISTCQASPSNKHQLAE